MGHSLTLLLTAWLLVLTAGVSAGAEVATGPAVRLSDGLITVKATDVPARDLLQEVGRVAGIQMSVDASRTEPVTVDLERVPVDEAIRRIVKHRDLVFMWEQKGPGFRELRLIAARVYAHGKGPAATPPATSRVARNDRRLPDERFRKLVGDLAAADQMTRADALVALRDSGDGRALELIASRLRDEDEGIRVLAIDSYGKAGGREAVGRLAQAMRDEPSPAIRLQIARTMVRDGGPDAVGPLRQAMAEEKDPGYRAALLEATATADPKSARDVLQQGLADPSPYVRERASSMLQDLASTQR